VWLLHRLMSDIELCGWSVQPRLVESCPQCYKPVTDRVFTFSFAKVWRSWISLAADVSLLELRFRIVTLIADAGAVTM
jgi:hypothetical protein